MTAPGKYALLFLTLCPLGCSSASRQRPSDIPRPDFDLKVTANMKPAMVKGEPYTVTMTLANPASSGVTYGYVPVPVEKGADIMPYSFEFRRRLSLKTIRTPKPSPYVFRGRGSWRDRETDRSVPAPLKKSKPLKPGEQAQCSVNVQRIFSSLAPGNYSVRLVVWPGQGIALRSPVYKVKVVGKK